MNKNAREFREKYKVEQNSTIEDFIKREQIKIRTDKKLNDKQKKERLAALKDILDEYNSPNAVLRRRNEDQWEK